LGDTRTKKKQIAYIQRKAEFAPWLETITRSRRSAISEYEWIGMVDCSEEEYAQRLRESMIYLVCGSQEGLNLSAIEAMASGCIVLGFSGVGGKDYMVGSGDRQNAVLVEGNDYFALGREIENVTTALEKNPDAYADLVRNALETASRFSDPEKESASLEGFFQNLGAQMASSD
jgi:glycosyltransferase involved in cell wall biosynthesis